MFAGEGVWLVDIAPSPSCCRPLRLTRPLTKSTISSGQPGAGADRGLIRADLTWLGQGRRRRSGSPLSCRRHWCPARRPSPSAPPGKSAISTTGSGAPRLPAPTRAVDSRRPTRPAPAPSSTAGALPSLGRHRHRSEPPLRPGNPQRSGQPPPRQDRRRRRRLRRRPRPERPPPRSKPSRPPAHRTRHVHPRHRRPARDHQANRVAPPTARRQHGLTKPSVVEKSPPRGTDVTRRASLTTQRS